MDGYLNMNVGAVRTVVVQLWTGPVVVRLLGPGDPHPTVADLDAISVAMTAANDGVRPAVRVLARVVVVVAPTIVSIASVGEITEPTVRSVGRSRVA